MRTCFDTLVLFTVAQFQLAYVEFKRSREFSCVFRFFTRRNPNFSLSSQFTRGVITPKLGTFLKT